MTTYPPKLRRLGMKSPVIIVSALLSSLEDQCLEMQNCINHLQGLLLLLVKGMHTVSLYKQQIGNL